MAKMLDLLFVHAVVLTMRGAGVGVIEDGAVGVLGDRIAAVGPTAQVLRDIAARFGGRVLVSLMRQYTPFDMQDWPELDRTITEEEYADACALFEELGLGGFFQQGESVSESFIPAFDGTGVEGQHP